MKDNINALLYVTHQPILVLQAVQQLKTKAWADIVESLIGLIYLEAGENAAMEFLVYLGILPEVPCGFVEPVPPAAVVEELGMDDAQLAADIAAAEAAAAGMDLNMQQAPSEVAAVTAGTPELLCLPFMRTERSLIF